MSFLVPFRLPLISLTALLHLGAGGCADPDGSGAASPADPTTTSSAPSTGGAGGTGGTGAAGAETGGSGGEVPPEPCPRFAAEVVESTFGEGQNFGQTAPQFVLGAPRGAGCCAGSFHVVSLGNGGTITLGFAESVIVDGEGPDFVVFENAFYVSGDESNVFAELATVEVSDDGETWHTFPCDALEPPYGSCAGWHPVFANADDPEAPDPLDPAVSGGDAFDLADVGLAEARFVRIVDRPDQAGDPGVFDLDAVGIVQHGCEAR